MIIKPCEKSDFLIFICYKFTIYLGCLELTYSIFHCIRIYECLEVVTFKIEVTPPAPCNTCLVIYSLNSWISFLKTPEFENLTTTLITELEAKKIKSMLFYSFSDHLMLRKRNIKICTDFGETCSQKFLH